jgi:hypothetical protein
MDTSKGGAKSMMFEEEEWEWEDDNDEDEDW